MRGSAWLARRWTSSSGTHSESRSVMTAPRNECGESSGGREASLEAALHYVCGEAAGTEPAGLADRGRRRAPPLLTPRSFVISTGLTLIQN